MQTRCTPAVRQRGELWSARRFVTVVCTFMLVWSVSGSGCFPVEDTLSSPSIYIDPLLQSAQLVPLTPPDLPPPHPRRELSFRNAAHTIFLDEIIAPVVAEGGFDTVVQVFPWRDLHPEPDRYAWDPADYMVRMAHAQRLDLVVRLDMLPGWAILPEEYSYGGIPFDLSAYADFVAVVAERYRGYVLGYIVWNEPDLAAEWARSGGDLNQHWESFDGWVAQPDDYVYVLCVAYERIRAADPDALVVAVGMAPTNEMSPRAIDDREFLRGMYAAGAQDCFDVLSVHDYGLSPEASREMYDGLNLARILDVRDIMLSYGDDRLVWITDEDTNCESCEFSRIFIKNSRRLAKFSVRFLYSYSIKEGAHYVRPSL